MSTSLSIALRLSLGIFLTVLLIAPGAAPVTPKGSDGRSRMSNTGPDSGYGDDTANADGRAGITPVGDPTTPASDTRESSSESNDSCTAPRAITGTGLFSFDNADATTGSEAQNLAACDFEGSTATERDVWFSWTASCSGPVSIQTCGLTNVDTKLAVYNGTDCPIADGRLVACDDDGCGLQSSITFQAAADSQYLIQLGGYAGAVGGRGQFRITCEPPPQVACCLSEGRCLNLTEAACRERGGEPQAAGTACAGPGDFRPPPPDNHRENIVPLEWQPKHRGWNRDANQNFVEDNIDAMSPNAVVDVLLELNRVPGKGDLRRFGALGTVAYVGRHIPVVGLKGVRVADAVALGQDPRVAMVEFNHAFFPTTNVSVQAVRVRGSTVYNPFTVESAFPLLTGAGVSIAIMDTGVDDGTHAGLPASAFVGGFDALANAAVNPNDDLGHGTHVAGIALGRPVTVGAATYGGVAPGAGLVDMQVFKPGSQTTNFTIEDALDECVARRIPWNIRVINMSLGDCRDSNGTDAVSKLIGNAVNAGIVVITTMANANDSRCPPPIPPPGTRLIQGPAAADKAIAVQAASYQGDVNRANDVIDPGVFLRGPRLSDGDLDPADELKPDVSAYSTNSSNASPGFGVNSALFNTSNAYGRQRGTSMAAPHVAGVAALLLQARPDLTPPTVKELIKLTAEDRGTPGWNDDWGYGLLDGFAALQAATQSPQTDLKFETNCGSPDPLNWSSPDVFPGNPFITEGEKNTVNARIVNAGPNTAGPFKVTLGIYDFSNSQNGDHEICTVEVPGLAAGQTHTVSCEWEPEVWATTGLAHACLKARIIHPQDSNTANDCAQHNVQIVATQSPARFNVAVVNPTGEDLRIRLEHDLNSCGSPAGWKVLLPESSFVLRAGAPPRRVEVLVDPGEVQAGAQLVNLKVVGVRPGGDEVSLGGVTLVAQTDTFPDCNNNGVDDSLDVRIGASDDADHNALPDECEQTCAVPSVTRQPVSQNINAGAIATFSALADGTRRLNYQWRKNGVNLADGGPITGATGPSLNVRNAGPADAGSYDLIVSNACGATISAAATLNVQHIITGQVTDHSGNALPGVTVTLSGGSSATTTTDGAGAYHFAGLAAGGDYTVTPSTAGFTFAPASRTFNALAANQSSADFTASALPTTVQFDAAAYEVNEGVGVGGLGTDGRGFRIITVTRTGDGLPAAASVDYATSDGTATHTRDYTRSFGTLHFGPGEATRTFAVSVTDDVFAPGAQITPPFQPPVVVEAAAETVNLTLSNPVGTSLGAQRAATLTVNDDDATTGASPVKPASFNTRFFVRQHYLDFLNREPDAGGFDFWVNEIESCGADAQCREVKRVNVSAAFFLSIEFQETGYFAYLLHQAAFDTGERLTLGQFLIDVSGARRGVVVGLGDWEEQLAANKQGLALLFVERQAFTDLYPETLTPSQFVDALNANTGGSLSPSERDARVAELLADNTAAGRAGVLLRVVDNAAFRARESNRAFVLMQYFGYLRRNPNDPPDGNFDGYNFWLAKLNQFGGDFIGAEMVKAFIDSIEYSQRFGQ